MENRFYKRKQMSRFKYGLLYIIVMIAAAASCGDNPRADKKLLILGIDGMDPLIYEMLAKQGKLPAFEALAEKGGYSRLWSSIPPQSPVAWANFITGMDPGGHGIFDFVHRKPETLTPFLSVSEAEPPDWILSLHDWLIPLKGGSVTNLRQGKAFWEILEDNDIPATILGIPSNFPPVEKGESISGMGTPDLLGTYGEFTFFTSDTSVSYGDVSGGDVVTLSVSGYAAHSVICGPQNPFKRGNPAAVESIHVYIDPEAQAARIDIGDESVILSRGEWSGWIPLDFSMIPGLNSVSGICRLYLKETHPHLKLYVSPVNINPAKPAMPISNPPDFAETIAADLGCFYTQGMAEDTKAFEFGILNREEFKELSLYVLAERLRLFDWAFKRFKRGVLFVYFSSLDLNGHMFYRTLFPENAFSRPDSTLLNDNFLAELYVKMDSVLAETMKKLDGNTTLMVMSDHGFAPFYKKFNLNTWLYDEGYVSMFREWDQGFDSFFQTVDWGETKAYAMGLNGLYVNLRGRESFGIVDAAERNILIDEIAEKLAAITDPETGDYVIKRVYKTREMYHGSMKEHAPDIIVGYARGFRGSDASAMGEFPPELLTLNEDRWGGDHCMAMEEVPGVLFMNTEFSAENPSLFDLAPAVLDLYSLEKPEYMIGNSIFSR